MKTLMLILLMTSFQSCHEVDISYEGEQCAPFFVYKDSTEAEIDTAKSFCSVRMYEMNMDRVGSLPGTDSKRPIQYCQKCVGFKEYGGFADFASELRIEIVEQIKEAIKETKRFLGTSEKSIGTGKN